MEFLKNWVKANEKEYCFRKEDLDLQDEKSVKLRQIECLIDMFWNLCNIYCIIDNKEDNEAKNYNYKQFKYDVFVIIKEYLDNRTIDEMIHNCFFLAEDDKLLLLNFINKSVRAPPSGQKVLMLLFTFFFKNFVYKELRNIVCKFFCFTDKEQIYRTIIEIRNYSQRNLECTEKITFKERMEMVNLISSKYYKDTSLCFFEEDSKNRLISKSCFIHETLANSSMSKIVLREDKGKNVNFYNLERRISSYDGSIYFAKWNVSREEYTIINHCIEDSSFILYYGNFCEEIIIYFEDFFGKRMIDNFQRIYDSLFLKTIYQNIDTIVLFQKELQNLENEVYIQKHKLIGDHISLGRSITFQKEYVDRHNFFNDNIHLLKDDNIRLSYYFFKNPKYNIVDSLNGQSQFSSERERLAYFFNGQHQHIFEKDFLYLRQPKSFYQRYNYNKKLGLKSNKEYYQRYLKHCELYKNKCFETFKDGYMNCLTEDLCNEVLKIMHYLLHILQDQNFFDLKLSYNDFVIVLEFPNNIKINWIREEDSRKVCSSVVTLLNKKCMKEFDNLCSQIRKTMKVKKKKLLLPTKEILIWEDGVFFCNDEVFDNYKSLVEYFKDKMLLTELNVNTFLDCFQNKIKESKCNLKELFPKVIYSVLIEEKQDINSDRILRILHQIDQDLFKIDNNQEKNNHDSNENIYDDLKNKIISQFKKKIIFDEGRKEIKRYIDDRTFLNNFASFSRRKNEIGQQIMHYENKQKLKKAELECYL